MKLVELPIQTPRAMTSNTIHGISGKLVTIAREYHTGFFSGDELINNNLKLNLYDTIKNVITETIIRETR